MAKPWPARCPLCLVFLLAPALGCQVMYRYRPIPVVVRDAETKKPIANADVHLYYPLSRDSLAPFDSSDRTDADGVARLRGAPYGDFGARIEASAPGYLSDQADVSSDSIRQLQPPHFFEETQRRKPELFVELFAEPHFSVELIVPPGYRGLIKAEIEPQEDAPVQPGQRCFRYEVVDGLVRIKIPALVHRRVYASDYRARYADGTPLGGEMTLQKVGFRWLRGRDKEQLFVVGTLPEYDMERRYASDEETVEQRAARNAARSGRGSRHRRDN